MQNSQQYCSPPNPHAILLLSPIALADFQSPTPQFPDRKLQEGREPASYSLVSPHHLEQHPQTGGAHNHLLLE